MKPHHDRFPKPGDNLHDQSGNGPVCAKCKTPVQAKAGFRPSALKCPKCSGKPA